MAMAATHTPFQPCVLFFSVVVALDTNTNEDPIWIFIYYGLNTKDREQQYHNIQVSRKVQFVGL